MPKPKTPKRHRADNDHMVSPLGRGPEELPVHSPAGWKTISTPTPPGRPGQSGSAKENRRG